MATVAVVHVALGGHVGPATRLGAVLVRQGHRVVAWAPEGYREQIEASGADFRPYDPAPLGFIAGGLPGFAAMLLQGTERHVAPLIEQLLAEDVELVVHDYHAIWGRVAADFLGLPRIVSNPLFPLANSPAGVSGSSGVKPLDMNDSELFPAGWEDVAAGAHATSAAIGRRWGVELGAWHDAIRSPGATCTYTTEVISGTDAESTGTAYLGPLMSAPASRPTTDPPLVYVAFGTFSTFRPETYGTVLEALQNEPVQVVLSTGRGVVTRTALEPVPANATVHAYVDSQEILARASVHVTHAGASSVHESLIAGVPMVCVPQHVDQFLWAERIDQLNAGQRTSLDASEIRSAVRSLLTNPLPRASAQRLGVQLLGYDGERRVASLVARALD